MCKKCLLIVMTILFGTLCNFLLAENVDRDLRVTDGRVVFMQYTLLIDDNKIIETTIGKPPFIYVHGKGQILPALEDAVERMKVGEVKTITIEPKDGYGEIKKEFLVEVPKEKLPEGSAEVGRGLEIVDKSGNPVVCRVKEVKDKTVVLDFNHFLAGKALTYRVKILDIQELRDYL